MLSLEITNNYPKAQDKKLASPASAAKHESPFKSFRKPKKRVSLEDESSQDFVPIKTPERKRRPLTEHQKERFSKMSDDIPALYSELSRDNSQVMLPPEFHSQTSLESIPESSEVAMDVNDFEKVTNQKRKRSEHWELSPSKKKAESRPSPTKEKSSDEKSVSEHQVKVKLKLKEEKKPQRHRRQASLIDFKALTSLSGIDSDSSDASTKGNKRKKRTPVKNLTPQVKRTSEPSSRKDKKRGRPPGSKKRPLKPHQSTTKSGDSERVEAMEATAVSVAHSETESTKNLNSTPTKLERKPSDISVRVERLSHVQHNLVKASPVKVIQEQPLVIVSAPDAAEAEPIVQIENGDEDIVESSQPIVSTGEFKKKKRGKKRKLQESTFASPTTVEAVDDEKESLNETNIMRPTENAPFNEAIKKGNLKNSETEKSSPNSVKVVRQARNKFGKTPLHVAVKKGNLERVKTILQAPSVDVNAKDNAGWTPIHEAIRENEHCVEILKLLIESGADVNVHAEDGNTPLHDAVAYASEKVVKVLIDSGADPRIANNSGARPIDLAPVTLAPILESAMTPNSLKKSANQVEEVTSRENSSENTKEKNPPQLKLVEEQGQGPSNKDETNKENEMISEVAENLEVPSSQTTFSSVQIRSPLPNFTRLRRTTSFSGRGAKLLEMSKAKGQQQESSEPHLSPQPQTPIMSPKVSANTPVTSDNLTTPTSTKQAKPWEKFQPSPSTASPSASILKKTSSMTTATMSADSGKPPAKRRRVKFSNPPVSEKVEIPRCPSSGIKAARQRLSSSRFSKETPLVRSFSCDNSSEAESLGLYQESPPLNLTSNDPIYPNLILCDEPVTSLLANLATVTWQKSAERSLRENGISLVSHLAKMTPLEAQNLKGLKPPNNVATIREALKKHERIFAAKSHLVVAAKKSSSDSENTVLKKISPVIDICTPEEEEQTMKKLYETKSPSPTEEEKLLVGHDEEEEEEENRADDAPGSPPSLITNQEEDFNIPTIVQKLASSSTETAVVIDKVTDDLERENVVETSLTPSNEVKTQDSEVQVYQDCQHKEVQTNLYTREEKLEQYLNDLESFEAKQIHAILLRSAELLRDKF